MSTYKVGDIRKLYGPYEWAGRKKQAEFPTFVPLYFMETPDGDAEYRCPGDCEGGDECTSSVPAAFEGKEFLYAAGIALVARPPEDFSKYMCAGNRHPDDTTSEPYRGKRKFTIITEQMAYGLHLS